MFSTSQPNFAERSYSVEALCSSAPDHPTRILGGIAETEKAGEEELEEIAEEEAVITINSPASAKTRVV